MKRLCVLLVLIVAASGLSAQNVIFDPHARFLWEEKTTDQKIDLVYGMIAGFRLAGAVLIDADLAPRLTPGQFDAAYEASYLLYRLDDGAIAGLSARAQVERIDELLANNPAWSVADALTYRLVTSLPGE